jgi:sugar O-acyltransferase (sialic acid O-acetyltransferase NeuD family)
MKKIAIYGAGGFGREVLQLIEQINSNKSEWKFEGFFDDGISPGTLVNDFPVLGSMDAANSYSSELYLVIAVGNPLIKRKIVESINNPFIIYPSLIHPDVTIDKKWVALGKGIIITAGNIVTVNITIGDHVILNLQCTVGHDTVIHDYCSLMPGVRVSGEVVLHENVYIGTGASVINQVMVGRNTIIGAGAVVTKNIPSDCTAVGVPATPIKQKEKL